MGVITKTMGAGIWTFICFVLGIIYAVEADASSKVVQSVAFLKGLFTAIFSVIV